MKRIIPLFLSILMLASTVFTVSSAELGSLTSHEPLNSWRYTNGVPDNATDNGALLSSGASSNKAWTKTAKGYINGYGSIIKNATMKGIDVSEWNYNIDWAKVKKSDIDYAIIRVGYGDNYTSQDDKSFKKNVEGCIKYKIPFGVYIYSYAKNTKQALSEAKHVLRLIKGYKLDFPVYYDMEENFQTSLGASTLGSLAKTFCNEIQKNGYKVGIYANLNWWNNYLTSSVFNNKTWYKWVAQYNYQCDYKGSYTMWQCASDGVVSGISGRVDLNFWYGSIIKSSYDNQTPTVTVKGKSYTFYRKGKNIAYKIKLEKKSVVDSMVIPTEPETESTPIVETTPNVHITTNTEATENKGENEPVTEPSVNTEYGENTSEISATEESTTEATTTVPKTDPKEIVSVVWTCTNKNVAGVDNTGKLKIKKKGTCNVTAKVTIRAGVSKTVKYKITVKQLVTKIKLNKAKITLKKKGKTNKLKATCTPTNANNRKVKWKTNRNYVAVVNQRGKVTARKKGTCYITATAKDGSKKYARCKVTVLK